MFYLPTLTEYHVNQSYALHTNVRGSITMSIRIGYTIFCVGVWFILHRGLVHFASHLVFFAPELYLLFILLIFLYSSFFSYLKKTILCISHKKKEHDCALLLKLKKTVDLQLASCYTTDSDGIVQQPS